MAAVLASFVGSGTSTCTTGEVPFYMYKVSDMLDVQSEEEGVYNL